MREKRGRGREGRKGSRVLCRRRSRLFSLHKSLLSRVHSACGCRGGYRTLHVRTPIEYASCRFVTRVSPLSRFLRPAGGSYLEQISRRSWTSSRTTRAISMKLDPSRRNSDSSFKPMNSISFRADHLERVFLFAPFPFETDASNLVCRFYELF